MNYFLAKTDPDTYSIDDLEREQRTAWDGVTNAQAVRVIREMRHDRLQVMSPSEFLGVGYVYNAHDPDTWPVRSSR